MPVGGQTAVALAFTKASRSPSLPAMKYAAPSASNSPTPLSKRDWIIQSPMYQDGGARAGVARGLAHQRRCEHPVRLHPGEVTVARDAAQIADAELGAPRPEADQLRHETREGAGPREAVLVDAEPQVAVDAGRVRLQHAPVGVPHRFAVFRGAPRVALQVALARAVAERGGEPELARGAGGLRGRPRERDAQQRVDAPRLVRVVLQRRRPPDVGARLEDQRRGVGWVVRGEGGEVRGGRGEAPAYRVSSPARSSGRSRSGRPAPLCSSNSVATTSDTSVSERGELLRDVAGDVAQRLRGR